MLVNQIQRDMNSSNQLETCAALTAVCKIVTADMVPAVIGDVVKLLKHEMESVRKRAVCALHRYPPPRLLPLTLPQIISDGPQLYH
jgi:AP-4 complex subunit epsilon-1